jgi:hypothetical protein
MDQASNFLSSQWTSVVGVGVAIAVLVVFGRLLWRLSDIAIENLLSAIKALLAVLPVLVLLACTSGVAFISFLLLVPSISKHLSWIDRAAQRLVALLCLLFSRERVVEVFDEAKKNKMTTLGVALASVLATAYLLTRGSVWNNLHKLYESFSTLAALFGLVALAVVYWVSPLADLSPSKWNLGQSWTTTAPAPTPIS